LAQTTADWAELAITLWFREGGFALVFPTETDGAILGGMPPFVFQDRYLKLILHQERDALIMWDLMWGGYQKFKNIKLFQYVTLEVGGRGGSRAAGRG
jgi:hypothetical protein